MAIPTKATTLVAETTVNARTIFCSDDIHDDDDRRNAGNEFLATRMLLVSGFDAAGSEIKYNSSVERIIWASEGQKPF